ncbi:MAG: hypothetical protein ACREEM_29500, partial [Blastocatellia bacterium]
MAIENDDDVKNPSKKRGGNKDDDELAMTQSQGGNLTVACEAHPPEGVSEGGVVTLTARPSDPGVRVYTWTVEAGFLAEAPNQGRTVTGNLPVVHWNTADVNEGSYLATVTVKNPANATANCEMQITVRPRPISRGDVVPVTLRRTATVPTTDLPLWIVIRKTTEAISFDNYLRFMDMILCGIGPEESPPRVRPKFESLRDRRFLPYNDVDAYRLLKVATEAFLVVNCGVALAPFFTGGNVTQAEIDDIVRRVSIDGRSFDVAAFDQLWQSYLEFVNGTNSKTIPYLALIRDKLRDQGRLKSSIFAAEDPSIDMPEECFGILSRKLTDPCLLELIWSYWHEEGMLTQTMNAISQRFQNVRGPGDRDPLANFETDPLRPINNLLWGYIQDEQHRLSMVRRVYEYDHHYGMSLYGKAVPALRPADSRSKFLEAFHNLLYLCSVFYKSDDDTTVIADGFPVLNALKEVHLLLSEGAHNQFGDLPSAARQEMLIQQWILARPEFREYLPTRIMVAYPERWMDRVDAMKHLQGWTDTSVLHFRNLGDFGEKILLSIRFGAWSTVNDAVQAVNWARFWR